MLSDILRVLGTMILAFLMLTLMMGGAIVLAAVITKVL